MECCSNGRNNEKGSNNGKKQKSGEDRGKGQILTCMLAKDFTKKSSRCVRNWLSDVNASLGPLNTKVNLSPVAMELESLSRYIYINIVISRHE